MIDVAITNLNKTYNNGSIHAIKDLSFDIEKGELFGLIGPDGSGKTSLFRILTTVLLPDSGDARVNGLDIKKDFKKLRETVGYMPGKFSLYQDLTVEENLRFFATVFNTSIEANYDLIRDIYVQIEPFKTRRAGKLSGGMKQKLALCCALIHRPQVLFLDEPTTGVDAVSRKEFWEMLKRLKREGITVLVSTPYMDEAGLCEHIALIQNGRILDINTPPKIIEAYPTPLYAAKSSGMSALIQALRRNENIDSCYAFGDYHHITLKQGSAHAVEVLRQQLISEGHQDVNIQSIIPGIEDCFIKLMHA